MSLKGQVIASIVAVALAQGGCLHSIFSPSAEPTVDEAEAVESGTLLGTEESKPESTIDYEDWLQKQSGESVDPIAANSGQHNYEGINYDNTCRCQPTEVQTRNFEFSDDSVTDGNLIYTKTGDNSYVYYFEWYRIEVQEGSGVETQVETDNYVELVFTDSGFYQKNYTDVKPGEGEPCCYYQFFKVDD